MSIDVLLLLGLSFVLGGRFIFDSPRGPHRPSVAGRVGPLVLAGCGLADADIHRCAEMCGVMRDHVRLCGGCGSRLVGCG